MSTPDPGNGPTRANWQLVMNKRSVNEDGAVEIEGELRDTGKTQGTLRVTMTADRELLLTWTGEPDAEPLADFRAYKTTKTEEA